MRPERGGPHQPGGGGGGAGSGADLGPGFKGNTLVAAATTYAAKGWAVFPLRPCGKEPLTAHGFRDATTDPEAIAEWWRRWPEANVAIATGSPSGVVVLDVDPRNGGDESLRDLEARHGPLPDTPSVITGGGGQHYYFALPPGATIRTRKVAPGLDLKGAGGYVVAPPSVHPSGQRYEWELGRSLDDLPLAPLPAWLLGEGSDGGREWQWDGEPVPEGRRHTHLVSLAGRLRSAGLGVDAIEAALLLENKRRCQPPLPEREVQAIARSMVNYPPYPNLPSNGSPAALLAEPLERELAEAASDLNHARIVAERLRGRICWVASWGWMVYRDGVWHRDPDGAAAARLAAEALSQHYLELAIGTRDLERRRDLLRQAIAAQARARAENALHMARDLLRAEPQDFDARPGLLCAKNGVIDLTTGQLLPPSPDYRFTRQTAVAYDPEAQAPQWEAFLQQVFLGNEAIIRFVQRLLGRLCQEVCVDLCVRGA
ncbi:MAG: bifunctional DNA primase/polymerase [Dehalococcoidia bacterium]|nr:bifunctional DNA primase/polymerase [Dehalococcoidia bacterium]